MNKTKTLETIRNLTPDAVLFSPGGRFKIALLQLVARLLPSRFAIWLSLLDDGKLERQVKIELGLGSPFPGRKAYNVPRYREPWNYEPETQEIFRRLIELRYRFLPYLYSEAHHSARIGITMETVDTCTMQAGNWFQHIVTNG